MKKLLFLWLVSLPALAQTNQAGRVDFFFYPGNPYESPDLPIPAKDTALTAQVVYTLSSLTGSQLVQPQPQIRRRGLFLTVSFLQTLNLPRQGWYEVKLGGITRYSGYVSTARAPAETLPRWLADEAYESRRVYRVTGVPAGHVIEHGKATRLVRATFYRSDTGQIDPLWRGRIETDNQVITYGPPAETFTGTIVLEFFTQTNY